jgi:hypothetical protein
LHIYEEYVILIVDMGNLFGIKKSLTTRYRILKTLYDDWNFTPSEDRTMGSIRLAKSTNIPIADIDKWSIPLSAEGEILISYKDDQLMMSISEKGRASAIEKRYLKQRKMEIREDLADFVKIVVPVATLILALYTFFVNKELKERIIHLEQRINILELKVKK